MRPSILQDSASSDRWLAGLPPLAPSDRHDEVTMLILAADIGGSRAHLFSRHGRGRRERPLSGAGSAFLVGRLIAQAG